MAKVIKSTDAAIKRLESMRKETYGLPQEVEDFMRELISLYHGGRFKHLKQVTFINVVIDEVQKTFGETVTVGQVQSRITNAKRKH